jgi:hypothetical protein
LKDFAYKMSIALKNLCVTKKSFLFFLGPFKVSKGAKCENSRYKVHFPVVF